MDDTRLWVGGGAVVAALVLGAGWFGLVGPERATIATQQSNTDAARAANSAQQAKVTALKRQSENMTALTAQLRTVRTQLPIYGGLPAYFDQLAAEAGAAKVGITTLTVGSVTAALSAATATTATSADTSADSSAAASATPTPTTTAAAGTTGTTATTATTATSAGPAGQLFQIALTVVTTGPLAHQEAFLEALQKPGGRTALVTTVQLAPLQAVATVPTSSATTKSTPSASTRPTAAASIVTDATLTTALTIYVAPQTPAAEALLNKQLSLRSTK